MDRRRTLKLPRTPPISFRPSDRTLRTELEEFEATINVCELTHGRGLFRTRLLRWALEKLQAEIGPTATLPQVIERELRLQIRPWGLNALPPRRAT